MRNIEKPIATKNTTPHTLNSISFTSNTCAFSLTT